MKEVDVVFGNWLKSPNGASSVVGLLYDYEHLFEKNGVKCNFYTNDNYWPLSQSLTDNKNLINKKSKTLKKGIKNIITRCLKVLPTLNSAVEIYRKSMLPGKRIAEKYTSQEKKEDSTPVFFHELFTCYYYIKYTKAKRPILLTLHNNGDTFKMLTFYYPNIKESWVMTWLKKIEKKTFTKVSNFCFVANNPKSHFIDLHQDIDNQKVHYVYNGLPIVSISSEHFEKPQSRPFELCCVGSITSRKGQDIIIKCLEELSIDGKNKIHITFVGDGPKRKELENISLEKGLQDNVTFVGNQQNVNKYLEQADIFILTSRDEGFPMAILEAERIGLPVISTNIAGIPEMIIDGVTGLIINPDHRELLPILEQIDKYDWQTMGLKSKELFYNKFTINDMINNYSKILKTL